MSTQAGVRHCVRTRNATLGKGQGMEGMKRFLDVANLRRLEQRTGVGKQAMYNYLTGKTKSMRTESYLAIRKFIEKIEKEMRDG